MFFNRILSGKYTYSLRPKGASVTFSLMVFYADEFTGRGARLGRRLGRPRALP